MKIVQVCPLFHPSIGGVETHVFEISRQLVRFGADVTVLTTDPTGKLPKEQIIDGIRVRRFRSFSPKNLYFFSPRLFSAIRNLRCVDVIHVHAYPNFPALACALAKAWNRVPLIFTPHYGGYFLATEGASCLRSVLKTFYNYFFGGIIFGKANVVLVLSKSEKDLLRSSFGVGNEKIQLVPNGINVDQKHIYQHRGGMSLLYVGRIEKYKGLDFLLDAFIRLQKNFPLLRLIFVGNGSYKHDLISRVKVNGCDHNVLFLQNVPRNELLDIYLSSSVFVLLSQYEGLPIALLEAMACSLPVVASRVGGIPEVVESGKSGFLIAYPPENDILCEKITLLLNDSKIHEIMGFEARKRVSANFSWHKSASKIYEYYREVSLHLKFRA